MMSLSIVAAKDIEQAIELLASRPRKAVKDHLAEEPEGVGNFLYDFRAAFTNYQCYHRFDPYGETCLEMDQVPAIKAFSDSVRKWLAGQKWLAGHSAEETSVIQRYGVSFKKIRGFVAALIRVCNTAMEHGYGLAGIGD